MGGRMRDVLEMRRIPAIHACQSDVTIVCAFFSLFI